MQATEEQKKAGQFHRDNKLSADQPMACKTATASA
jgi:hypothetical protein